MNNITQRYMILIVKIFIGILLGVAILFFIGYFVDRRQRFSFLEKANIEMQSQNLSINEFAPVIVRKEILIDAPTEQVWDKLTTIKDWTLWQSAITDVKIDSLPQKNIPFLWTSGGVNFSSTIHTNNEFQSFGWIGTTWGAQAIHNWSFIKENDKTRVIVEESLQGLLVDLFSGYFQKNLTKGTDTNLKELKDSCEQKIL